MKNLNLKIQIIKNKAKEKKWFWIAYFNIILFIIEFRQKWVIYIDK